VKNVTTNFFKIENKERIRDISNQRVNLFDFGISENTEPNKNKLKKAD